MSFLSDPKQNFDFNDPTVKDDVNENRLMKLKVRTKGILQ